MTRRASGRLPPLWVPADFSANESETKARCRLGLAFVVLGGENRQRRFTPLGAAAGASAVFNG